MLRLARIVGSVIFMASVLIPSLGHAQDEPADAPDPKIESAKKHFAACIAFLNDPEGKRWEEAYPECKQAYELSGSLNALNNLALCATNLELDGEAVGHYETLLKDEEGLRSKTNLSDEDIQQLRSDLGRLKNTVAWVRIATDQPGVALTDERTPSRGFAVRNTYKASLQGTRIGMHPGAHVITAIADGYPDQTWKIRFENGKQYSHEFIFDKSAPVTADGFTEADQKELSGETPDDTTAKDGSRPVPAYVWAMAGVTLGAAGTMTGMMVVAKGKKSDYEASQGVAPIADQQKAFDDVKQANLLADIFLGVTAASAVTTVILLVTRPEAETSEESTSAMRFGHEWTLSPSITPRGAGAWVTARF